jgi:hypothetical protein
MTLEQCKKLRIGDIVRFQPNHHSPDWCDVKVIRITKLFNIIVNYQGIEWYIGYRCTGVPTWLEILTSNECHD